MASLEMRYDGRYRIVFCWQGERLYHSLGKLPECDARSCLDRLEESLRFVERGLLEIPPGTRQMLTKAFRSAVKGSAWEVVQGYHMLRYSFASNCARKGVDQRIAVDWMGHQTKAMRRRYRHLFPDQQQAAIQSVFE